MSRFPFPSISRSLPLCAAALLDGRRPRTSLTRKAQWQYRNW